MKMTLLIVSSVLLSIQVHATQLYGWVGKPGEGQNYFILDSSSSASGSLADLNSLTLLMPYTGETTYTPSSIAMTLGSGFSWSPAQITAMSLSFYTTWASCPGGTYYCDVSLAEGKLYGDVSVKNGNTVIGGSFVDDSTGSWLAFASLADYQAALATTGSSSVPESGNSALLLLGTLLILILTEKGAGHTLALPAPKLWQ